VTIDELVGENLRRAREAVGLSIQALAERVAAIGAPMTAASLQRLEAGREPISVDQLVALGLALGIPPGLLLAPLNLGSLLCVDGDGRATASWSMFHDWARPFSPAGQADTAEALPPSPPPLPPATLPAPAEDAADLPGDSLDPAPPPPPDEQEHPEPDPVEPAEPPAPATPWPPQEPVSPHHSLLRQERDWVLEAIHALHGPP
jgi:transcriptional regulator with XRE-family HTH domain